MLPKDSVLKDWEDVTVTELKVFLGVIINMALNRTGTERVF